MNEKVSHGVTQPYNLIGAIKLVIPLFIVTGNWL